MEDGERNGNGGGSGRNVVDIYPLSRYYFGSKDAIPEKDDSLADRIQRLKASYAAHGLRTCVEGVLLSCLLAMTCNAGGLVAYAVKCIDMLSNAKKLTTLCYEGHLHYVELFQHPHVLLLQVKNSFFKLPGGRLRPGESDIEGLKRKLSRKLSLDESRINDEWQVDECIGIWWRSEFETLPFPYLPPNTRRPKECTKLFLVRLPRNRQFVVPKNLKLLAVPLCQIHDNSKIYGPIISGIPHLLSKFSFNTIHD